jgi:GDPmannose 4,6-dehydratase
VDLLIGDSSKAREKLGWKTKVSFEELVKMMIKSDLGEIEPLNQKSLVKVRMAVKGDLG